MKRPGKEKTFAVGDRVMTPDGIATVIEAKWAPVYGVLVDSLGPISDPNLLDGYTADELRHVEAEA